MAESRERQTSPMHKPRKRYADRRLLDGCQSSASMAHAAFIETVRDGVRLRELLLNGGRPVDLGLRFEDDEGFDHILRARVWVE